MTESKNYFSVNDLAPRENEAMVFFKKVVGKKSDGFAVVNGGKVYVIDSGKEGDTEVLDFLLALRERWMGEKQLSEGTCAKLELVVIVSHPHPDHIAALPLLLDDERFCVTEIYAPLRSCLSFDPSKAPPSLVKYENQLETACEGLAQRGHTAKGITRVPFGEIYPLETGSEDFTLKIYPAHIDWSQDLPSDKAGYRYILANNPAVYRGMDPEKGYANGILNGNSLWVKVTKDGRSVLITGDQRDSDEMLGSMIRHYGENEFRCDVLKIPHHGETNYSPYLLGVAKPKRAVFTTSLQKATPDTVKLCEKMGCVNYYTSDGEVLFCIDKKEIKACGIDPR